MTICNRCNQEPVEQVYHSKNRKGNVRPVGSPGLHVARMICACGCKSVRVFFCDRLRPQPQPFNSNAVEFRIF